MCALLRDFALAQVRPLHSSAELVSVTHSLVTTCSVVVVFGALPPRTIPLGLHKLAAVQQLTVFTATHVCTLSARCLLKREIRIRMHNSR